MLGIRSHQWRIQPGQRFRLRPDRRSVLRFAAQLILLVAAAISCFKDTLAPSSPPPAAPPIQLSPTSATTGDSGFVLTITGARFANERHLRSVAIWSAHNVQTQLETQFVGDSVITAAVPAALVRTPVDAWIGVLLTDPTSEDIRRITDSVAFKVSGS